MGSLLTELKRRNVFKVGVAYAIVAWLIMQVVATFFPALHLPDWTVTLVAVLLLIGLPVALLLAWAFELTPEGIKPTQPEIQNQIIAKTAANKLNYIIIGLLSLVIVFLVVDNYVLVDKQEAPVVEQHQIAAPQIAQETPKTKEITITDKSVAVLPFINMSSDKEQEYFADGLTEEILNRLAQVQNLKVAARTSSFYYKGKNVDISEIGAMLNVAYVIEGSVRKSKDTVRITAQLNRAMDGYHVWSKTYDKPFNDILAVQDEISKDITKAMQVTLGMADFSHIPGMTTNAMAYDAYLKGKKAFEFHNEDIAKAIKLEEQAVKLDPNFALAWYRLYTLYAQYSIINPGGSIDWQTNAIKALGKAMELAPNAYYVIFQRAVQSIGQRDWVSAERHFKEAADSAAQYGSENESLSLRVTFLSLTGRSKEALALVKQQKTVDPLNEDISEQLIKLYDEVGDLESALAETDYGNDLDWKGVRRSGNAFVAALATGDRAEIKKRFAQLPPEDNGPESINGTMMSLLDDRDAALQELNKRIIIHEHQTPLDQSIIAIWSAYFKDPELALKGLKGARNLSVLLGNAWSSIFSDTRKLPGFRELLTDLGLANYWRTTDNWADDCKPVAGGLSFKCE